MQHLLLRSMAMWTAIVLLVGIAAVVTDEPGPSSAVAAVDVPPQPSLAPTTTVDGVPATSPPTTADTAETISPPPTSGPTPRRETTTTSGPGATTTSTTATGADEPDDAPSTTTGSTASTSTNTAPTTTTTTTAPAPPAESQGQPRTAGDVLLVWTSGGLRDGYAESITSISTVTAHTTVWGDLVRLVATADSAGTPVDRAPDGWAFPVDAFAVDPASYASFQDRDGSSDADDVLASLPPGGAVLTRTSAALRRIGVGGTLTFASGTSLVVHGIVDDVDGGGAEVLVHRQDAASVGIDDERFLLLTDSDRAATEAEIRERTPSDLHLSVRSEAETTYLRHGDRVDPQILVKRTFGEFVFQDAGGRDIRIDPAWVDANIVTEEVPLLGRIRCHRAIVPKVRAAMERVRDAGAGDSVNPSQYAGCYNPRRIGAGAGLSRHTWGLALDINVGDNPRGDYETQHPELVAAMKEQGFSWGGDWEYPDPAHYEARA